MICAKCDHPFDWHGDRAIGGCDGGWDRKVLTRPRVHGDNKVIALCNCPGWSQ